MPGPRRGYSKLSISVFTTGPSAFGLRAGTNAFFSALITATPRSSPLMLLPADVEHEAVVFDGATDAADVDGVFLDHHNGRIFLGQAVGCGEPRGPGADDQHIRVRAHRGTRGAKANSRWPLYATMAPIAAPI